MKRGPREVAAAVLFLTLLTCVVTYPVVTRLRDGVPGDLGDPLLYIWTLDWNLRSISRGLRDYFDAPMFYPYRGTLTYSEHLMGHVPLYALAWGLTRNPVTAYDLVFLATFALSGIGMYVLVRSLTGNGWAAVLAATVFLTMPWRFGQIFHLHVLSTHWLPWVFWLAHRWVERPSWPRTLGLAGLALLQAWSSSTYGAFLPLFALAFGWLFLPWPGTRRHWVRLGVLVLAFSLGMFPFYRMYRQVYDLMGFVRTKYENIYFSADAVSLLCAPSFHRLYGTWTEKFCKPEGVLFPGLVAAGLALASICRLARARGPDRPVLRTLQRVLLVGMLVLAFLEMAHGSEPADWHFEFFLTWSPRTRRILEFLFGTCFLSFWVVFLVRRGPVLRAPEHRVTAFYTIMLVAAVVLAMGPVLHFGGKRLGWGPYVGLFRYAPGFQAMRVPARGMAYGALALSVLAGLAVRHGPKPHRWVPVFIGLVLLEGWHVPLPMERIPPSDEIPPVYRWLQTSAEPGVPIIEVPMGRDHTKMKHTEFRYLYFQLFHRHPMVNGLSGFFPEVYLRLQDLLHGGRFSTWVEALAAMGARYVVVHTESLDPMARAALVGQPGLRRVAALGNDLVLEVRDARPLEDTALPAGHPLPLRLPRWSLPGRSVVAAVEWPDDGVALFRPPRHRVPIRIEVRDEAAGRVFSTETATLDLPHLVTPWGRYVSLRVRAPVVPGRYRVSVLQASGERLAEGRLEVRDRPPASPSVLRAEYLRVDLPTWYAERALRVGGLGRARIRNVGDVPWDSTWDAPAGMGSHGVRLRWRLFDRWGTFLGEGTGVLPFDVTPGDEVEVSFRVEGFSGTGPYALSLEVVPDGEVPGSIRDNAWAIFQWDIRSIYVDRPQE